MMIILYLVIGAVCFVLTTRLLLHDENLPIGIYLLVWPFVLIVIMAVMFLELTQNFNEKLVKKILDK